MGAHQLGELGSIPFHDSAEGPGGLFQVPEPTVQILESAASLGDGGRTGLKGGVQALKPLARPRPAQQCKLQAPDRRAERRRAHPARGQGMLERREQRNRRRAFGYHLRGQAQEGPGRSRGERLARRVVDLDAPPLELGRDPARQAPVGRNQCRRPALFLVLQHPAHDKGDDARFLVRGGAVEAPHAPDRLGRKLDRPPGLGLRRRAHGFGDQLGARRAGGLETVRLPVLNLLPGETQPRQQPFDGELRMGGLQPLPVIVSRVAVESGEDDPAPRKPRHHLQEVGRGRDGAGGAGGDHRIGGRLAAPGLGLGLQHQVAPGRRVDRAFLGQDPGPMVGQDAEEFEGDLPVRGIGLGHQVGESVEAEPLDLHLIQETTELGGKLRRLVRARCRGATPVRRLESAPPLENEPGESQATAQLRHRRLEVEAAGRPRFLRAGKRQLVLVEIADRHHPRQQQRPAPGLPEERLAQRPAGAPCREQEGVAAQGEGIASGLGEHARSERVEEGDARWNRVDCGPPAARPLHPGAGSRAHTACRPPRPSRRARAAASPAGVPMWNHAPSWTRPWRRSAAWARS